LTSFSLLDSSFSDLLISSFADFICFSADENLDSASFSFLLIFASADSIFFFPSLSSFSASSILV